MGKKQIEGMENVDFNKSLLLDAFEDLRQEGLIAREDFLCCQSCAGYSIAEEVSKMPAEEAKKVKGCVYWHGQDEENLQERGSLYLAYGELDTKVHGKVGLPTVELGKMIIAALEMWGLHFEWNGQGNERIWVDLTKSPKMTKRVKASMVLDGLKPEKRLLEMTSWDGNAFSIMGKTKEALKEANVPEEEIGEVMTKCKTGDYSHLLATCVGALQEAGYEVV